MSSATIPCLAVWVFHHARIARSCSRVATVQVLLDVPEHLASLAFPEALDRRLQTLLDKQDGGERLRKDE